MNVRQTPFTFTEINFYLVLTYRCTLTIVSIGIILKIENELEKCSFCLKFVILNMFYFVYLIYDILEFAHNVKCFSV